MNIPADPLALSGRRKLYLFCGAGISMLPPSNAPSWWGIYSAAATALFRRMQEEFPLIAPDLFLQELLSEPLSTQDLATLVVNRFGGDRFLQILQAIDTADPNENHRAIARLAASNHISGVVTTNYDTLLERAASAKGLAFNVVSPAKHFTRHTVGIFPIIKLHGTVVDHHNISEALQHKFRQLDARIPAAWKPLFKDSDLLVIGYSGADMQYASVGTFFAEHLRYGERIWWLHLPNQKPSLPPEVDARTTYIEGHLPDLLRAMAEQTGEADFNTPLSDRDSAAALDRAMDEWSKEPMIRRWGAATFFLGLCRRSLQQPHSHTLLAHLYRLASEQSQHIATAAELVDDDIASINFLAEAAEILLVDGKQIDLARQVMQACVKGSTWLVTNVRSASNSTGAQLAGVFNNLGLSNLMNEGVESAEDAFTRSLTLAYLCGTPAVFINALGNILSYVIGLRDVNRCSHLAEACIRLADMSGNLEAAINLRHLSALYCLDRNEVWSAKMLLQRALELSSASRRGSQMSIAKIVLGETEIRAGRFTEGLTLIAETAKPDTAYFDRPVIETISYLNKLGIIQSDPYSIKLSLDSVQEHAASITARRETAIREGNRAALADLVEISRSAFIGTEDARLLNHIGILELLERHEAAAEFGNSLAILYINNGCYREAHRAAQNVYCNPYATPEETEQARELLAWASASLGNLIEAESHFLACERYYQGKALRVPFVLAKSGLWFFIQCSDWARAETWVNYVIKAADDDASDMTRLSTLIQQVESWGPQTSRLVALLRGDKPDATIPARLHPSPEFGTVFRMYTGLLGPANDDVQRGCEIVAQAAIAANEGNEEETWKLLDQLAGIRPIPEQVVGAATAVQLELLRSKLSASDLDQLIMERRRDFTVNMAFTALSCLERAACLVQAKNHEFKDLEASLRRHGWIGLLSEDVVASKCILGWFAKATCFGWNSAPEDPEMAAHVRALDYFGVGEGALKSLGTSQHEPEFEHQREAPNSESLEDVLDTEDDLDLSEPLEETIRKVRSLRKRRKLSWRTLGMLREAIAVRNLEERKFECAAREFRKCQLLYRRAEDPLSEYNAAAGEGRALGMNSQYNAAVAKFEQTINEISRSKYPTPLESVSNLLQGLGVTHLQEAIRRGPPIDAGLAGDSIRVLENLIDTYPPSRGRAFARVALARAYGEIKKQDKAIAMIDTAISEFAHLNETLCNFLIEYRPEFASGNWIRLELL